MLIDYINPFVEATFEIMSEILNSPIKRGQIQLKNIGEEMKGIAVIIGVTGNVSGRIIFDMNESTALLLSEKLNNEQFSSFNTLARSTISEIANMITGRAVTKLAKDSRSFNFSPPTLLSGANIFIFETGTIEALIIPIDTGYGVLDINIAFKENN
ncbi:MAG: chemotaxis protein CheX [Brevinemataceae bacterium]